MIATSHSRMLQGAIAAAALTLAGTASAQVAAQPYSPLPAYRAPVTAPAAGNTDAEVARRAIDLSAPRTPLAMSYAQTVALREAGQARTSVDRQLPGLTGSLGFLCGLQPRLDENSGSAYGIDPHGRFLGAKLSHAF